MIVVGDLVGLLFAHRWRFAVGVVSFPMLIDGRHGRTTGSGCRSRSARRCARWRPTRWPIAVWGLIVAAALVLGSIPFFLGLVVVLPVLGHATWHLYRRTVG